jgi:flagellin FlaA/flagellin FlaB
VTGAVSSSDTVDRIDINVKRESGAGNIDLADATIQYVGPDGVTTLTSDPDASTYDGSGATATSSSKYFGISTVKENGDDTSIEDNAVLNDNTDVANVSIVLSDGKGALDDLDTGETVTMTVTTDAGGETEIRVSVPDTLQGSAVTLSP